MTGVTLSQSAPEDMMIQWQRAIINVYGENALANPILCTLLNLLDALEWYGSSRKIVEALPANDHQLNIEDLRNTLARLGVNTIPFRRKATALPETLCPCLFVDRTGKPRVIQGRVGKGFTLSASDTIGDIGFEKRLPAGELFLVEEIEEDILTGPDGAQTWLKKLVSDFRPVILSAFGIAFLINVLSLTGPLSIMLIYDQVIAKESIETLDWLVIGVGIAVCFEIFLRIVRARAQAYIGAKLDHQVGLKVFAQVLHLPPLMTERAPVGGQVTRIRDFDSFREIFSGPLAGILLDLPFTLLFIIILFWIGGPIAIIPICLGLAYFVLAKLFVPALSDRTKKAGKARSNRYSFLVELMWWMRSVKQQDGAQIWRDRLRKLSADASWANYNVNRLHSSGTALAQTIMFISGVATLGIGVGQVSSGAMSLGALIATMILVWRILGPIQTLFSLASRLEQIKQSLKQLVDLLGYRREQEPGHGPVTPIEFKGKIEFNRISMRYAADANPAMLGVSFTAYPGELIGIAGESGAGKSTLAKLAMGLYVPQGGSVTLDGIDLRQLRPITLRQTLGYVPQKNHAFPGTLYENIRLADPTASFEQVRSACRMAGILHKIEALPQGFETSFKDGLQSQVPQGFLRQLALARAFLTDAPVYVFDEPTSSLDEDDERFFLRALELLRGDKTVLMVTQRPSHMLLCDRLLYLEKGQVRMFDKPERVLDSIHAASTARPHVVQGQLQPPPAPGSLPTVPTP